MLRWWICSTTKNHNRVKGHRGNVWNQFKQSEPGLSALKQKEREGTSVHSSFVCKIFYPECFACCSVCCRGGGSKRPSWQGAHSPQTWPADPARSPHNRGRCLNPTLPRPRRFLHQRKDFQLRDKCVHGRRSGPKVRSLPTVAERVHHREG